MLIKIKIVILLAFIIPAPALAFDWGECPFDNVNDSYPGFCGRYRDLDNDGLCDLSQMKPEVRGTSLVTENQPVTQDKFNVILITLLVLFIYGISEYLLYLNKNYTDKIYQFFNPRNIRWFWNVILLWSFLIIIITSIINLLQLSGWLGSTKINYSFWHIRAGIVMLIVSLLHIIKRWRHFVK